MDKPCCSINVFKTEKGLTLELSGTAVENCCAPACCEPKK